MKKLKINSDEDASNQLPNILPAIFNGLFEKTSNDANKQCAIPMYIIAAFISIKN